MYQMLRRVVVPQLIRLAQKRLGGYLPSSSIALIRDNQSLFASTENSLCSDPFSRCQRRYYGSRNKVGKSSSKTGKSSKSGGLSFDLNSVDFSPLFNVAQYETDMQSELDNARMEFQLQYALRTDLKAYEETSVRLTADQTVPLNHLATVSMKDKQTVIINVSSMDKLKPVKDALQKSALNLNPQVSGLTLIVPLPKVTREHRETLAKNTKTTFTKFADRFHKIKSRYQKGWDIKESQGKASPELVKQAYEYTEHTVKKFTAKLEEMMNNKQKELLEEMH